MFPSLTYGVFNYLCSSEFANLISRQVGVESSPDIGLHGGGWYIHSNGVNLNPHLDNSIHPKLKFQRKINLIVYLSEHMIEGMGGEFVMWPDKNQEPADLIKSLLPLFNRAVKFETSPNSWHGVARIMVA